MHCFLSPHGWQLRKSTQKPDIMNEKNPVIAYSDTNDVLPGPAKTPIVGSSLICYATTQASQCELCY